LSGHVISETSTLDEFTALIRATFPGLSFANAELVDHGDDNLVIVLDGEWIVRFPRNEEYLARFAAELNLLRAFAPLSPLPVPNYEFVAPDKSFGAYRRIRGREMTPALFAVFPPEKRRSALKDLSAFLSVLHALPAETIAQPDGSIAHTWTGEQFAALYRGMRRAKIARVVPPQMLLRFDAFHDAFEVVPPGLPRLVHDDISDDHILVDGARISGIIDFSDASFGDPAIDFAWFWRLGEASLDAVLADYRFASEDRALKRRSHWTFVRYMINQLTYGPQAKWGLAPAEVLAELEPHLKELGF
jgi:aminoglycoside phosphotransferase (APT) family kinase protein